MTLVEAASLSDSATGWMTVMQIFIVRPELNKKQLAMLIPDCFTILNVSLYICQSGRVVQHGKLFNSSWSNRGDEGHPSLSIFRSLCLRLKFNGIKYTSLRFFDLRFILRVWKRDRQWFKLKQTYYEPEYVYHPFRIVTPCMTMITTLMISIVNPPL